MPTISRITQQKKSPTRCSIYIDGKFAFGLASVVAARFGLRQGMDLPAQRVEEIRRGQVRQDCMDRAMRFLERRLHSSAELNRKLLRAEFDPQTIDLVLGELKRLGYMDDQRFARSKAESAMEHRQHGKRRALAELLKAGVRGEDARRAVEEVYADADPLAVARELAAKQAPRLRKLDPATARRRLAGMLARRGFDYDQIKPVIDQVLGKGSGEGEENQQS